MNRQEQKKRMNERMKSNNNNNNNNNKEMCSNQQTKNRNNVLNQLAPKMKKKIRWKQHCSFTHERDKECAMFLLLFSKLTTVRREEGYLFSS